MKQGKKQTGEDWRDNYQTPAHFLERVELLLGDLYYDAAPRNPVKDSLATSWPSQTYINPPFSDIQTWVAHGMNQPSGQVWMCPNNTERPWFQTLLRQCNAICFPDFRIHFIDPRTGEKATRPRQACVLFYRGDDIDNFITVFSYFGLTVKIDLCYDAEHAS